MSSFHGWMLLCLATAGPLHPHPPRTKPAPVVKGVALRAEPAARPPRPESQGRTELRAADRPIGLPSGMRF